MITLNKNILTTEQIQDKFINYFVKNEHVLMPSSSLIGDSSLMFTNSGMVQFKNIFTGKQKPIFERIVTNQNCVRAGGKHNDLDNVGHTKRHHTFFQMLGNFSFGKYFKKEAITYAWDFLTKELHLDPNKLYSTVYHTDTESFDIWKKITRWPDSKIIKIANDDNFWSMGDSGPCGPCSEIFYDQGEHLNGGLPGTPNQDGDRFVEIWNMVFMEYEKYHLGVEKYSNFKKEKENFEFKPLEVKCIDTGMGLERISAIMQGVSDNYEIDIFQKIIHRIFQTLGESLDKKNDLYYCYKIIADHIRAIVFIMLEGLMPSNEGRGYVLRRIIRRAAWHMHLLQSHFFVNKFDAKLNQLIPHIVEIMHINTGNEVIKSMSQALYYEEDRFLYLIDKGKTVIHDLCNKNPNMTKIDGKLGFELYDTHGFPLDLIKNLLNERKIEFEDAEFDYEMHKQKQRGKDSWENTEKKYSSNKNYWRDEISQLNLETNFIGYDHLSSYSHVNVILINNQFVNNINFNQLVYQLLFKESSDNNITIDSNTNLLKLDLPEFLMITQSTPFYGESGGQCGDIGFIVYKNYILKVLDTQKVNQSIVHLCKLYKIKFDDKNYSIEKFLSLTMADENYALKIGDKVHLIVDENYRNGLKIHHTATHLLHAALRNVLGGQVGQKGSCVMHNSLRFDFNHHESLSNEQLKEIEGQINQIICENYSVTAKVKSLQEAKKDGAICLFSEKYDDYVRVIQISKNLTNNVEEFCTDNNNHQTDSISTSNNCATSNAATLDNCIASNNLTFTEKYKTKTIPYSMELCGGTHVNQTAEICSFIITSEKSIGVFLRRIEAKCNFESATLLQQNNKIVRDISTILGTNDIHLTDQINNLMYVNKNQAKEILNLKLQNFNQIDSHIINIKDHRIHIKKFDEDQSFLKVLIEQNIKKYPDVIFCYFAGTKFFIKQNPKFKPVNIKELANKLFDYIKTCKGGGNQSGFQGDFGQEMLEKQILDIFTSILINLSD